MASTPLVPENVAHARQLVQTGDFFALCYLMLTQLAYTDENDATKASQQIANLLPTMPVPAGTVPGKWDLSWGPEFTKDNSNLMYGAEFSDSVSGLPVFAAVVIRGTDTQAKPSGIIKQLVEDLDAVSQTVFPAHNQAGSRIAKGTQEGLATLTGFVDGGKGKMEQYLSGFVTKNPGAPVVVTGHSLGGCQTTVMALYLAEKLPVGAKIVPNSFAAPTAGNSAFIQQYEKTFPFCPRWFNTLDLVPMAFAGLDDIQRLWDQCKRPAPEAFKAVTGGFKHLLKDLGDGYCQQSAGNSRSLAGVCQPAAAPVASKAPMDVVVREVQDSLRRAAARVHVPVPDSFFRGIGDWVKELLFQHLVSTGYWNAVASSPDVASIPNPFAVATGAGGK